VDLVSQEENGAISAVFSSFFGGKLPDFREVDFREV
jgi:hypothetical protein